MDDFSFGNVWGDDSSPKTASSRLPETSSSFVAPTEEGFNDDEFGDEFSAPIQATLNSQVDDDDFGDFGDFGDVSEAQQSTGTFDEDGFGNDEGFVGGSSGFQQQRYLNTWQPLRLDPLPSSKELKDQLGTLLEPLWDDIHPEQLFSRDDIRQVEGPGQVLVTPESRSLYQALLEAPPPQSRPPNWTRSRIRRQHLISLGIPVNLDEVLPQATGKPMPALNISTRPMSAPPTPRPTPASVVATGSSTRSSTPKPDRSSASRRNAHPELGQPPVLDQAKIDQVLALSSDNLSLLPLPTLNAHLATIQNLTVNTSSVLTHLLQTREALQQDSETYNKVIADLISRETQKMKAGGQRSKRGSAY